MYHASEIDLPLVGLSSKHRMCQCTSVCIVQPYFGIHYLNTNDKQSSILHASELSVMKSKLLTREHGSSTIYSHKSVEKENVSIRMVPTEEKVREVCKY